MLNLVLPAWRLLGSLADNCASTESLVDELKTRPGLLEVFNNSCCCLPPDEERCLGMKFRKAEKATNEL